MFQCGESKRKSESEEEEWCAVSMAPRDRRDSFTTISSAVGTIGTATATVFLADSSTNALGTGSRYPDRSIF